MGILKIGLIGCGSIGTTLANYIDKAGGLKLLCVYDADSDQSRILSKSLESRPRIAKSPADMSVCDLVIEAASQEAVQDYALEILGHSDLMMMSVGALSDSSLFNKIKKKAEETGRHVYIPSGAIAGLDAIKAASMAKIEKATLTTRKPPLSLEDAPYVIKKNMSMRSIRKPTLIFEGTAKEAAEGFPKNINVSVSLSLAGIGVEKTRVKIIADPFTDRNVHEIEVEGSFGKVTTRAENVTMPKNQKTSYLAALSAMAILEGLRQNVRIGT